MSESPTSHIERDYPGFTEEIRERLAKTLELIDAMVQLDKDIDAAMARGDAKGAIKLANQFQDASFEFEDVEPSGLWQGLDENVSEKLDEICDQFNAVIESQMESKIETVPGDHRATTLREDLVRLMELRRERNAAENPSLELAVELGQLAEHIEDGGNNPSPLEMAAYVGIVEEQVSADAAAFLATPSYEAAQEELGFEWEDAFLMLYNYKSRLVAAE